MKGFLEIVLGEVVAANQAESGGSQPVRPRQPYFGCPKSPKSLILWEFMEANPVFICVAASSNNTACWHCKKGLKNNDILRSFGLCAMREHTHMYMYTRTDKYEERFGSRVFNR